jgi:hypothetical protein
VRLETGKEIIGILHAVEEDNGCNKLQFSLIIEIELPSSEISYEKINPFIGKKIGLLNLDNEIFIREVKI